MIFTSIFSSSHNLQSLFDFKKETKKEDVIPPVCSPSKQPYCHGSKGEWKQQPAAGGSRELVSPYSCPHFSLLTFLFLFCPLMLVSKHTGADTVSGPSSLGPPRSLESQPETPKELILRVSSFPKIHTSHSNTSSLASSFYKLMSGRIVDHPCRLFCFIRPPAYRDCPVLPASLFKV